MNTVDMYGLHNTLFVSEYGNTVSPSPSWVIVRSDAELCDAELCDADLCDADLCTRNSIGSDGGVVLGDCAVSF